MKWSKVIAFSMAALMITCGLAQAKPQVYPVGTIQYNPEKAWNSFVILSSGVTAKMIDRNGNLVKEWDIFGGGGGPSKIFPGGYLLSSIYPGMEGGYQDGTGVGLFDFDGKLVRKFTKNQKIEKPAKGQPAEADGSYWASRQHHDIQLEGSSAGYHAPGEQVKLDGKMMMITHRNINNPKINPNQVLLDDLIIIVDKDENILWSWSPADHFEELGLNKYPGAMKVLAQKQHPYFPIADGEFRGYDWFHMNCASWLGPNKWYDAGDQRFHPDNIILDSRETGHLIIVDHKTGKIAWQVSPPFKGEDEKLGEFIGPHHTHMIPRGLPGEGNIMVFDNGGKSPYFAEVSNYYSRIVEFDPVKKEIVWEYSANTLLPPNVNYIQHGDSIFFSSFISSAQRLPNGNTLIDEGSSARLIEVTPEREIVWEYISPYHYVPYFSGNILYRAYAVPYADVPQLKAPKEVAVIPPAREQILIPDVEGNLPNYKTVLDKTPLRQFGEPTPVLTPAYKAKNK